MAEEYQTLLGKNGMELFDFGITWRRIHKSPFVNPFVNNQMKVMVNGMLTSEPKAMVEAFKAFFKEKVDDLLDAIKENQSDLLEPVREKFSDSNLSFELKEVSENDVLQIMKKLKRKTSSGFDQISAEVLKMGACVIAGPLTKIINHSIKTSKFPSKWKESKVCPVYKKGDRQT